MKKKFVHICEEFEYTWIGKDNGMIPIYIKELGDYDVSIVTLDLKKDLPESIRGVNFIKIKRWFKNIKNFAPWVIFIKRIPLYYYLMKNSKDIDVLMLFHMTKCSYWNSYFYKKFNPKGKIYIKADFNLNVYKKEIERTEMKPKNLREYFRKKREVKEYSKRKKLASMIDLISYESLDGYEAMKDSYAGIDTKGKTMYLPNGYDSEFIEKNIRIKPFEEKENIILTVGRLGTEEKNTGYLLDILERVNLKEWKFYFVGPIEKSFQRKIDNFFIKYPEKKENIIFTGEVKDRIKLYDYYNRSKVFILPSKWESFGIVMVEAMAFGNYILTSNTCAAKDITDFGKVGEIFSLEEREKVENLLKDVVEDRVNLEEKYKETLNHSEKFKYKNLMGKLLERI